MSAAIDQISDVRRSILRHLKAAREATRTEIAARAGISTEAARLHLAQLQSAGLISRKRGPRTPARAGRPAIVYSLTVAGENLFPKKYDELLVAVLHLVAQKFGDEAPADIWAALADARVRGWEDLTEILDLKDRAEALRSLYLTEDPYTELRERPEGYDLIEMNCPFLSVAMKDPGLCSTSVNMLSRLLGKRVVREERFQDGDGRCVFRIYANEEALIDHFEPEPPRSTTPQTVDQDRVFRDSASAVFNLVRR